MNRDHLWPQIRDLPYFRATLRAVEARHMGSVELPAPVLDLGCGDGHFASVVYQDRLDIGLDPDLKSLKEARQRDAYRLLTVADGARMPYAKASFASAISNSVLEHIPGVEHVLAELGRVLKPGAPLALTMPNPGYRQHLSVPALLRKIGLTGLALYYEEWFMRMSRTVNLYDAEDWRTRLQTAGFELEVAESYFSIAALRALEWGHYFGAPSLLPRALVGRWHWVRGRWNFILTERWMRRYYEEPLNGTGTYTFYLARRRA